MSMVDWWNDSDNGQLKYWEESLSNCHFVDCMYIWHGLTWDIKCACLSHGMAILNLVLSNFNFVRICLTKTFFEVIVPLIDQYVFYRLCRLQQMWLNRSTMCLGIREVKFWGTCEVSGDVPCGSQVCWSSWSRKTFNCNCMLWKCVGFVKWKFVVVLKYL